MNLDAARARLTALAALWFFAALHVFCFHLATFPIVGGKSLFDDVASVGCVGVGLFVLEKPRNSAPESRRQTQSL